MNDTFDTFWQVQFKLPESNMWSTTPLRYMTENDALSHITAAGADVETRVIKVVSRRINEKRKRDIL
jgi:hypothetical protein